MAVVSDITARRLLARVAAEQSAARMPSLVAGVLRDGELAWSGSHGGHTPAGLPSADMQYRIGSITKTFTAVLVLQLRDADVWAFVGLDLEIGWMPLLLDGARNAKIRPGGSGYLDVSKAIPVLDVPSGGVDRSQGDVHPLGNPHYWLDPENGRRIAKAVQDKLTELSRSDAAYFAQRYADFDKRLADAEQRWKAAMAPYKGLKIVTYHRSWPNFAAEFGLDVVGYVEPKPGIPPSPAHTLDLIQEMKRQNIKIVLVEPYFDLKTPNAIARETGAKVLVMPPSVGGVKEVQNYFQLFDYDINLLVSAIKETGAK